MRVNVMSRTLLLVPSPAASRFEPLGPDRGEGRLSTLGRSGDPALSVVTSARATVQAFDPRLPLASVRTLDEMVKRDGARLAFTMTLLLIASGVALLLGVIGIYGVIAYMVGQRTSEIGIRLVLGARPSTISGMIAGQAGLAAGLGMAVGLALALAAGTVMESMLFRVETRDPLTYAAVVGVVGAIVLAACWVPARRAARLDPGVALRR
jgi:ABC-type antimicrobial peptide transport system permease subunit